MWKSVASPVRSFSATSRTFTSVSCECQVRTLNARFADYHHRARRSSGVDDAVPAAERAAGSAERFQRLSDMRPIAGMFLGETQFRGGGDGAGFVAVYPTTSTRRRGYRGILPPVVAQRISPSDPRPCRPVQHVPFVPRPTLGLMQRCLPAELPGHHHRAQAQRGCCASELVGSPSRMDRHPVACLGCHA